MKVFLFATFFIPTPSMAPAIEPGDHVYVNKLLMGPLYVLAKGDNIQIDSLSVLLYKNLIEYETEKVISVKNGDVYLGDSIIQNYVPAALLFHGRGLYFRFC